MDDIHCHHKRPWSATNDKVVRNLFQFLNLSNTGLTKLNQFHELVGDPPLLKEKSSPE